MARLPTGIYPMFYYFFNEDCSLRLGTYERNPDRSGNPKPS